MLWFLEARLIRTTFFKGFVQLTELLNKCFEFLFDELGCRCSKCTIRRVNCIENLIAGGADTNPEDKNGETPLYYAAKSMYPECAEVLLDLGSDLYHW